MPTSGARDLVWLKVRQASGKIASVAVMEEVMPFPRVYTLMGSMTLVGRTSCSRPRVATCFPEMRLTSDCVSNSPRARVVVLFVPSTQMWICYQLHVSLVPGSGKMLHLSIGRFDS